MVVIDISASWIQHCEKLKNHNTNFDFVVYNKLADLYNSI